MLRSAIPDMIEQKKLMELSKDGRIAMYHFLMGKARNMALHMSAMVEPADKSEAQKRLVSRISNSRKDSEAFQLL